VANSRIPTDTGMSSKHEETRSAVNESVSINYEQQQTQIFESAQEKEVKSGLNSP
jgi:hypothetical protein